MSTSGNDTTTHELAWSVLRARGSETESFLQGQLTQDLALVGETGAWSLILEPDSVVMTSCFVQRRDDGFDLIVPRELAEVATRRLRRFLLRTKCALAVEDVDEGPFATLDEQIRANWPGAREFALALTPHSFGRAFVATTISFQKGCFTGQELVGRLDARGSSVPWRFVHVRGASSSSVDAYLKSKGPAGPQGVTSAWMTNGHLDGLGVAHRTLLSATDDESSDVTVQEVD
ncbi:MAG: YgfZ family protein [Acidimicrobiales bacterium]